MKFNVLHQCFHFIYLSENCWTKHTYTQKNTIFEANWKCKSTWISLRISEKSENRFPGKWRNSPYSSSVPSGFRLVCKSWRTSGRRVQISDPRGRKSRPTRASSTLDLPLLWLPTTATWGSSIADWLPSCAKMSCSLFTIGITECPSGAAVEDGACGGADDGSSAIDGDWIEDWIG